MILLVGGTGFLGPYVAARLSGRRAVALVRPDRTFYTIQDLRGLGLPVLGGLSAPAAPRRLLPAIAFAGAFVLLLAGFGAILGGVPGQVMRMLA